MKELIEYLEAEIEKNKEIARNYLASHYEVQYRYTNYIIHGLELALTKAKELEGE